MSISIGLAGKPNCGKSTFFKAATLANVEIANYPFTTIDANTGVTYVRVPCPCKDLGIGDKCTRCVDGNRFVPIEVIDVAGLVPDAHKGRGLGNAFLDNLRQASAIIHVVDASGGTDIEGNPVDIGAHDPLDDIEFLEREIAMWIYGILNRNWDRLARRASLEKSKIEAVIADQLAGAGVSDQHVRTALNNLDLDREKALNWTEENLRELAEELRRLSKPMIIAANKIDVAPEDYIRRLMGLDYTVIPTSAAAELALRMADKSEVIKYIPGDDDFDITGQPNKAQQAGLDKIKSLMEKNEGTGIQRCINHAALTLLDRIVVYPVEDENKFTDKDGNVLPDAFLMPKGSTAKDLAYMVHTEIGDSFLHAIDARTKRRLGEKHELADGDIIKIVSTR